MWRPKAYKTEEAVSAVYTLAILAHANLPRENFRIDGKILSFWDKVTMSKHTRDVPGFRPNAVANLVSTIAAVYILEQGGYDRHPDDPSPSSSEIPSAISCPFLDAIREVYQLVYPEDAA